MPNTVDPADREAVLAACDRFASGHGRPLAHDTLAALAARTAPTIARDHYGRGEVIEGFEREVASLLGTEAAVFMPSGTMAQQIALRIWCDRAGSRRVAFHPTCHLELHEAGAYRELHGLEATLVGPADRLMTIEDLDAAFGAAPAGAAPFAALLVELPQREIGGQLPAWDDLVALVARARSLGAHVHLDGARLWECGPAYARDVAEIAGLFDSVYVSFYKGLGGIAGAALAGPADVVAESRVWLRRHGGNLISLYPYVLSARLGLEQRLARMASYRDAALAVAAAIRDLPDVRLTPDPPHTNMLHVAVARDPERFARALVDAARETKLWLASGLRPAPEGCAFELVAGDATLELAPAEIAAALARALELAAE